MTRKQVYIIGGIIVALAVFLRSFHLGEWLHYELDQGRDFRIIQAAIDYGPRELPLQGPKAAGNVTIRDEHGELTDKTTLRLGPLFYYIEYASALLFGATPVGAVLLIVILSTLTVPLFYVFVRRFFDQRVALGLSAIMASGLFFVTYSRFGWNPNLMPFFMLLLGYALLMATDVRRTQRARGWWLIGAAVALAFVGHMHFLAFIAAPIIAVLYLAWSWRSIAGQHRVRWYFWAGALGVFVFLQTPLILNDMQTGGENTKAFIAAVTQKTDSDKPKTLPENIIMNLNNHARYYWLIVTGDQRAELPTLRGWDVRCDYDCRKGLLRGVAALVAMFAGLVGWFVLYRRERDTRRRHFLRLVLVWVSVVFALYIPLAYDMAPRFFLLTAPVALVFFGLIVHMRLARATRCDSVIGFLVMGLAIISNLAFVAEDFAQRSQAATNPALTIPTDHVLKEKTRMGLGQMTQIVGHMLVRAQQTGYPIWLHGQPEFKRAFWERIDTSPVGRFGAPVDLSKAYRHGLYFIIIRTQSDPDNYLRKVLQHADIVDTRVYGTLTLYELVPHEDVIVADDPHIQQPRRDPQFSPNAQKRYLWRQVLGLEKREKRE